MNKLKWFFVLALLSFGAFAQEEERNLILLVPAQSFDPNPVTREAGAPTCDSQHQILRPIALSRNDLDPSLRNVNPESCDWEINGQRYVPLQENESTVLPGELFTQEDLRRYGGEGSSGGSLRGFFRVDSGNVSARFRGNRVNVRISF